MQFTVRLATCLALGGAIAVAAACSADATDPLGTGSKPLVTSSGPGGTDSTGAGGPGSSNREWKLETIRGVVLGVDRAVWAPSTGGDTLSMSTTPVPGATIRVIKFEYNPNVTGGDSSVVFKELGVVATLTADANAKFEYKVSDPIVIKDGQPRPNFGYWLTITPPAGSPYLEREHTSVFFAEQFTSGDGRSSYFLNRP